MRLFDLVPPAGVLADLRAETKEGVLRELSEAASAADPRIDAVLLERILLDREGLGSTGLVGGVAIPHGKIAGIDATMVLVGRSRAGVPFMSGDGGPSRLFFAVIAPESEVGGHLKILARISRLLRDESLRDALLSADDADGIRRLLRGGDDV